VGFECLKPNKNPLVFMVVWPGVKFAKRRKKFTTVLRHTDGLR